MQPATIRQLVGAATITTIAGLIALTALLFRGDLVATVPITVTSPRAGLVMNPDAKVKMRGVQIGTVAAIDAQPDGGAALRLAIDADQFHHIPANVEVQIASSTVFGAKFVELISPAEPTTQSLPVGQVVAAEHVTVENNTLFQRLNSVLAQIEPAKLNATVGALSSALGGRGEKLGGAATDLDALLVKIDPSLNTLSHGLEIGPPVFEAYADAAPDLLTTMQNGTQLSRTVVEEQNNLDTLLVSVIGMADIGNDVIGSNRQGITDVVHLLAPTTDLTNEYNAALTCALAGMLPLAKSPPPPFPGSMIMVGFVLGAERYRYPGNLPKVAASGGPQCTGLPQTTPGKPVPYVVSDVNANPWQYGNQGILLNSDGLKQLLFGPIDGPPRNTAQIGQPG